MGTDKTVLIDLTQLTPETTGQLVKIQEDIVTDLKKKGKRVKPGLVNEFQITDEKAQKSIDKLREKLEFETISSKGKKGIINKLFGDQKSFGNIVNMGLNPKGFFGGLLTKGIPGFGAAVAAAGIIVKILKKFDDLEKKFTDQVNTKQRVDRENEAVARIQAGLDQEITTISPGVYDPRDSYNTMNEFNINRDRIESDYNVRTNSGVE